MIEHHHMSIPGPEEALADRLSFRCFCGFGLEDVTLVTAMNLRRAERLIAWQARCGQRAGRSHPLRARPRGRWQREWRGVTAQSAARRR
jgi:hypothetical protein